MSEGPLAVGGSFLIAGFMLYLIEPTLAPVTTVSLSAWMWLFILCGLATITVGLLSLLQ